MDLETLTTYLKQIARRKAHADREDFDPGDGGNFDDAYQFGVEDGEIYIAQSILDTMGESYDV